MCEPSITTWQPLYNITVIGCPTNSLLIGITVEQAGKSLSASPDTQRYKLSIGCGPLGSVMLFIVTSAVPKSPPPPPSAILFSICSSLVIGVGVWTSSPAILARNFSVLVQGCGTATSSPANLARSCSSLIVVSMKFAFLRGLPALLIVIPPRRFLASARRLLALQVPLNSPQ